MARPTSGREDRICVAQIGAAHGLKGEVRLFSFTEKPDDFARYGPLLTEDGDRRLRPSSSRAAKDHFIVKFQGIDDRQAAESLRNMRLYVARSDLPPPADEDTFYHADLIGLLVFGQDGTEIGEVAGIYNFGAGDLIEVRRAGGQAVMLPFTKAVVPEIDLRAGRLVVDPPMGALDETPFSAADED